MTHSRGGMMPSNLLATNTKLDAIFADASRPLATPTKLEYLHGRGKVILSNTGYGSDRYGVCEVCQKHCSEHWIGKALIAFDFNGVKFTHQGGLYLFGHRECLEATCKRHLESPADVESNSAT